MSGERDPWTPPETPAEQLEPAPRRRTLRGAVVVGVLAWLGAAIVCATVFLAVFIAFGPGLRSLGLGPRAAAQAALGWPPIRTYGVAARLVSAATGGFAAARRLPVRWLVASAAVGVLFSLPALARSIASVGLDAVAVLPAALAGGWLGRDH